MIILANLFIIVGALFLAASSIILLRSKDHFSAMTAIKTANFYALNFIFLGLFFKDFSLANLIKLFFLFTLNITATNFILKLIIEKSAQDKIKPDGKIRKLNSKKKKKKYQIFN